MNIYTTKDILSDLRKKIKNNKPFSLIRFGDGALKFVTSVMSGNLVPLIKACRKEGIPLEKAVSVVNCWGKYGSDSDYIDKPDIYFMKDYWERRKGRKKQLSETTKEKLKDWQSIYYTAGIECKKFCHPDVNYFSFLNSFKFNLFSLIKNKKVCCITNYIEVENIFERLGVHCDIIEIPSWYGNHFSRFKQVMTEIRYKAKDYDLWLVGGGELGRIYTGRVKELGGRAFDIGSVFDSWVKGIIPARLELYVKVSVTHPLLFELTKLGMNYKESL